MPLCVRGKAIGRLAFTFMSAGASGVKGRLGQAKAPSGRGKVHNGMGHTEEALQALVAAA